MHNAKYTVKKKSPAPKLQVKILNKLKIKDRVTQQVRDKSARISACIIDFFQYIQQINFCLSFFI